MGTMHKKEVKTISHEGLDGSTLYEWDPWDPPYPPRCPVPPSTDLNTCLKLVNEWIDKKEELTATARATNIITPDRTPEKIFLDTIRLLAKHTDNLVDELWYYIKDGKPVQTAVLLLAAQKHIRTGTSYKENGNGTSDGFAITINRIRNYTTALESEVGHNKKNDEGLEMKKKITRISLMLVRAVSQAGELLDGYIQSYPEVPYNMQVPHEEVHERVSSILKDYGFCPTEEGISIGNLCHYVDVLSKKESPYKHGNVDAIKAARETLCQNALEKAVKNKAPRGWELKYARRSFFPYWRSVLASRLPVKVIRGTDMRGLVEQQNSCKKSVGQESSPTPNLNLSLLSRVQQLSGRQPSRAFCSAALPLLKVLRKA